MQCVPASLPDCQTCGACCAWSFDWPEFGDDEEDPPARMDAIPDELVDFEHGRMRCEGDRCSALQGEIGKRVSCQIYEHRPAVCRSFRPGTDGCLMVRRGLGLDAAA